MAVSFEIVNLFLQDTGRYDQQYMRPYQSIGTRESIDNLVNRIDDVTLGGTQNKISGSLLSGITTNLIEPAATWERPLVIPNGWGESRLRFLLVLKLDRGFGTEELNYFQGYTDYHGISHGGHLDPKMSFFINGYMRVNRSRGMHGVVDQITECSQVLDGRNYSNGSEALYATRPADVVTGIQSNYLRAALADEEGHLIDTRMDHRSDVFRSRRSNAIPSNYLANVIDGYRLSQDLADFGSGRDDLYDRTIQVLHEPTPYENPFIRALSDMRGMSGITLFTMSDLEHLDPGIARKTDYQPLREAYHVARPGLTDWSQVTGAAVVATLLSNAVTALMVECLLVEVGFTCSTHSFNGKPVTTILGGQGVAEANMRRYFEIFVRRFELEVLPDVTRSGAIPVSLRLEMNLYSDSRLFISLDGAEEELFVVPSFCDSLMTPIVTADRDTFLGMASGIEDIYNQISSLTEHESTEMIARL